MKKIILLSTMSLLLLHFTPVAHAELKVAQCFEMKYPDSYLSSNTLTLTADVYALCDKASLGRGDGQKPVYSMIEQADLSLSGCPGPGITQRAGNGFLGKVSCVIRVADSPLASSRIGANQTTIKAWLAWDFSTKTVIVNHAAIPGPSKTNIQLPGTPATPTKEVGTTSAIIVESQETSKALKETLDAVEKVEHANVLAVAAEKSAIQAISKVSSVIATIGALVTEIRARIESSIEMLQRKNSRN